MDRESITDDEGSLRAVSREESTDMHLGDDRYCKWWHWLCSDTVDSPE